MINPQIITWQGSSHVVWNNAVLRNLSCIYSQKAKWVLYFTFFCAFENVKSNQIFEGLYYCDNVKNVNNITIYTVLTYTTNRWDDSIRKNPYFQHHIFHFLKVCHEIFEVFSQLQFHNLGWLTPLPHKLIDIYGAE